MRILIILACLVASSIAQGSNGNGAADEANDPFGPVLCALNALQIPDDINIDLSILIGPLKRIAELLKTNLDKIAAIAEPDDPTLQKVLETIVTTLEDIISSIEAAVSELGQNPDSLESIFEILRSILIDVIDLFTSLEKLILGGLGLLDSGPSSASNFVVQVSELVSESIGSILSNLADSTSSIPVFGDIFGAFNEQLLPIVKQVVSIVDGALGVSIPTSLGLGGLTSQVVNVIDNSLSEAIKPIVGSILPSGNSACSNQPVQPTGLDSNSGGLVSGVGDGAADALGSVLSGASGSSPSPGVSISTNVINLLGALVSSPAEMNIDDLLGSLGSGVSPSLPIDTQSSNSSENRTKVIRPSPETVCIPLKETRPTMIETLNSSLGKPLINVGVQMSSGASGQNADLGSLLDLLEPLLRILQPSISMLRKVPIGSLGSGLLNPVLQILESLLKTLSTEMPLDAEQITSRLLRSLVLLIGFTAVSSGGNPALSKILRSLLLSLGLPILSLLRKVDGDNGNLLQAISKTINSIGGDVGKLIGQGSTGGGSDEGSGGGGLLGLVGGLLNGLLG